MLIFVTVPTAAQVFSEKPLLPRGWLMAMLATMSLCMVFTFSRSAFMGLMVGLALLGLLRYRKMLGLGLAIILLLLVLPPAQVYVQHFAQGVQGEDLATQMRFGEYKDALTLIARYPWFGVGFSGTPDIDTYLGVSSVYLLIAEEMGFVGLLAFFGAIVSFLGSFFLARPRIPRGSDLEPIVLGICLAVAGAVVGGALDHYLFNLDFPHAAALLWLAVGLGAAGIRLVKQGGETAPASG
jgi:O-antigen ligase